MAELSSWLTNSFLSSLLKEGNETDNEVTIVEFSTNPAVADGDNFLSHLYRLLVDFKTGQSSLKSKSFIVKIPLEKGLMADLASVGFFAVEPKMYKEVLPLMRSLSSLEFGPKSYYCPVENGLVMGDLKEDGYVMLDKYKQFDYEHSKSAFEALAKYHAASVACHQHSPRMVEEVGDTKLSEKYKKLVENCVKMVGRILSEMEDCKSLGDYLLSRSDKVTKSGLDICKPKTNGLNVLNHGDLWINNILFQHDDSGGISCVKFVDFQFPRFCSPVVDLVFLVWSSVQEEVRESRQEELFGVYLDTLNTTLQQLGCEERLSYLELQEDLRLAEDWGVVTICYELPVMMSNSENMIDIADVDLANFQDDEAARKLFSGKHYRAVVPRTVKQFTEWISR